MKSSVLFVKGYRLLSPGHMGMMKLRGVCFIESVLFFCVN